MILINHQEELDLHLDKIYQPNLIIQMDLL